MTGESRGRGFEFPPRHTKVAHKGACMEEEMSEAEKIRKGICPSCGGKLIFQEGCKMCRECGWGACE